MILKAPVGDEIFDLKIGERVLVSGEVLTARDKAHARIVEHLEKGLALPFPLDSSIIYHCGPIVSGNKVISAGPTTSERMTKFMPKIMRHVRRLAIIGKGGMGREAVEAMKGKAVYLAFTGGAGALAASKIKSVKGIYWEDLGMAEAVWVMEVENLPCIVAIDANGSSIYELVERRVKEKLK